MPYKKGQSGNIRGRGKGTPNRTTKEAREILNQILFSELDNIEGALKEIRTKDEAKYLEILSKLLAYSLPRKTDVTSDDEAFPKGLSIIVDNQKEKKELEDLLDKLNPCP
jgi:hypothetical protein